MQAVGADSMMADGCSTSRISTSDWLETCTDGAVFHQPQPFTCYGTWNARGRAGPDLEAQRSTDKKFCLVSKTSQKFVVSRLYNLDTTPLIAFTHLSIDTITSSHKLLML
jgi:hypothetical protein